MTLACTQAGRGEEGQHHRARRALRRGRGLKVRVIVLQVINVTTSICSLALCACTSGKLPGILSCRPSQRASTRPRCAWYHACNCLHVLTLMMSSTRTYACTTVLSHAWIGRLCQRQLRQSSSNINDSTIFTCGQGFETTERLLQVGAPLLIVGACGAIAPLLHHP